MYETFAEIEALIGVAVENFELEFKHGQELDSLDDPNRSSKAKASIAKDTSAFANAGGGVIIYGVDEREENGQSIANAVAPVTNQKVSVDRLTQLVQTGTEPALSKFRIHVVAAPGGNIFVVSIDQADTAHQNKADLKYYHRVEATNPPMHHFQIKDVMNRRTSPIMSADIQFRVAKRSSAYLRKHIVPSIRNDGGLTAEHWVLEVLLPESVSGIEAQSSHMIATRPRERKYAGYSIFEISSDRGPLNNKLRMLPGQFMSLDQSEGFPSLYVQISSDDAHQVLRQLSPPIIWRLYVDNSPMLEKEIAFDDWCDY